MTPPVLTKQYRYSYCKFDLSISETFTSLEKEKQGLAVFQPVTGQDKQVVRTLSVENLSLANGVKLKEIDKF